VRVLYFAPAYYADYGARTHARYFFSELARDSRVSHAVLFPPCPALRPHGPAPQTSRPSLPLSQQARRLRESVRRRLPSPLRNQIDLYRPSPSGYAALSAALTRERIDTAVLRLETRFRYIGRLKRDHPELRLCVEYNDSPFDERLKGTPGERFWRREEVRQLGKADCVSVVTEYLRRYLISLRPSMEGAILVNPNGADPNVFKLPDSATRARVRRQLGIPTDAFVLGYVGGMEEWRRMPEIVSWVAGARGAGLHRLFLVLIGAGHDLGGVLTTIHDSSAELSGRVYCSESWVAYSEVPPLMTAFDVGVLSFQYPHCCQQKAFEYLLSALPVIGPGGSFPHELLSAEYGTFEFGQDFESFLATLRSVHDNLDACRVSALRGRELVAAEFTWTANARHVLDALEQSP
jgi:glycosyltransferase involved in cell wall biosynthesis